jgi:formylmethanofuran dehydrogenase subunit E
MLKKYTVTNITEKQATKRCAKCGELITIAFVEDAIDNMLCSKCRKETTDDK